MKIRRTVTALSLAAIAIAGTTGCSTRRIDPETTGSVSVPGTTWKMFCDGPNAFIWIPGHNGNADELEAVIYDHHKCVDDGLAVDMQDPARGDADGIVEDEDQ